MSATPMPFIIPQFFTDAGAMASGYKLFSYAVGGTTKQDTYADSDLTTANPNPIVLDAYGRAPIFLNLTSYKFVLATPTAADPPLPAQKIWTEDNVPAYATLFANFDISGVAGEATDTDNNVVYLSDGSDGKVAGRWYLTSALNDFSSSKAITIGVAVAPIASGATGTIRIAGRAEGFTVSNLTIGSVYYLSDSASGRVTSTAPSTNVTVLGKADSISTMVIEPNWGGAGGTVRGLMNFGSQTFNGAKTFSTQPVTNIGTATTLPGTIGGVFATDVVQHNVGTGQTNATCTDSEIPANMLNADGKQIVLRWGSTVATTGTVAVTVSLNIGGVVTVVSAITVSGQVWWFKALITRVSSSGVYVEFVGQAISLNLTNQQFAVGGLNFTAAIDLRTLLTTGADNTASQTHFSAQAIS